MESTGVVADSADPYTSGGGSSGTCPSSSAKKYHCEAGTVNHLGVPAQIESEIYTNGPVETAFTVYQDFYNYKTGIYHHVSGGVVGGHAVKIIGFGTSDAGEDYWLIANSWGTGWGMEGFFKIRQGDCGIDSAVYFCTPKTDA
jgi:cathepsin B